MAELTRREASVHLADELIGNLWQHQGTTTFEFDSSYWERPRRPVVGQVFEERQPRALRQGGGRLPMWFSNLLPEGDVRKIVARQHGFNDSNEYRLLSVLGGDLPGAIRVTPEDDDLRSDPESRFGDGLVGYGSDRDAPVDGTTESDILVRFSVAGVQLKLSMVMSGDNLTLAGRGEFGDCIVKLPRGQFHGVPENEFSMMRWAGAVGIDVPDVELRSASDLGPLPLGFRPISNVPVYVVKRFDRRTGSLVHMEDLNQVVGQWPERKYDKVSYERVGALINVLCGEADFEEYLRRLVFCIGIGNEDAHLKNWTLLYPDGINPRLSPAYDLVSTVQYDDLHRGLGLKLGRSNEVHRVTRETFEQLATEVGASAKRAARIVDETLELMRIKWVELEGDLPINPEFTDRLGQYQRTVPLLAPLV